MDEKEYKTSLRFSEENLERLNRGVPEDIRNRENFLLQKLTSSPHGRLKKLEILFSEMDIIYSHINKFTVCKKGCNHCCHYEIAISELETKHIKRNVKTRKLNLKPENNSCPFLKKGSCMIYKYRPFLCRRHLFVGDSPKWCNIDICNSYEFPLVTLTEVDNSYAYLIGENGMKTIKDIRQVFGDFST